ncbi:hypothetical protein G7085_16635 [Tessaracoccus sp. HDW20]|uniref:hypothetical protein n=1 Tax=Tessaracoccus coleopterorum TaxID=2714950 RepID=UPI0018D4CE64|nr:hypothetical protein [Tessaracoccus coleopterorum]NHB85674.1 hypothetical protein [Tessaracoccus coleopterorum]
MMADARAEAERTVEQARAEAQKLAADSAALAEEQRAEREAQAAAHTAALAVERSAHDGELLAEAEAHRRRIEDEWDAVRSRADDLLERAARDADAAAAATDAARALAEAGTARLIRDAQVRAARLAEESKGEAEARLAEAAEQLQWAQETVSRLLEGRRRNLRAPPALPTWPWRVAPARSAASSRGRGAFRRHRPAADPGRRGGRRRCAGPRGR